MVLDLCLEYQNKISKQHTNTFWSKILVCFSTLKARSQIFFYLGTCWERAYLLGTLLNFKVHSNCLVQLPATHFRQECRRGSSSIYNILWGHNTNVGLVGRQQRLWSTRNEGRISHQQRPMCIRGQLPWQSRKLKQAPSKSRMALATNNILKGIWYNACRKISSKKTVRK